MDATYEQILDAHRAGHVVELFAMSVVAPGGARVRHDAEWRDRVTNALRVCEDLELQEVDHLKSLGIQVRNREAEELEEAAIDRWREQYQ